MQPRTLTIIATFLTLACDLTPLSPCDPLSPLNPGLSKDQAGNCKECGSPETCEGETGETGETGLYYCEWNSVHPDIDDITGYHVCVDMSQTTVEDIIANPHVVVDEDNFHERYFQTETCDVLFEWDGYSYLGTPGLSLDMAACATEGSPYHSSVFGVALAEYSTGDITKLSHRIPSSWRNGTMTELNQIRGKICEDSFYCNSAFSGCHCYCDQDSDCMQQAGYAPDGTAEYVCSMGACLYNTLGG